MNGKNLVIAILFSAVLLALAFSPMTGSQTTHEYDPWADMNDDGKIRIDDVRYVASKFGTTGRPINKTQLLLELNATANELEVRTERLELWVSTLLTMMPRTIIFSDNFENYTVGEFPSAGGWILVWSGAGEQYQVIVDNASVSGTKSFQMLGRNHWAAAAKKVIELKSSVIGYEVYIMTHEYTNSSKGVCEVYFFNESAAVWGVRIAGVMFRDDGTIWTYGTDTETKYLGSYEPYTWYKVSVILDRDTNLYNIWINNKLVASSVKTANSEIIASLQLENGWPGVKSYFDDVKIFEFSTSP